MTLPDLVAGIHPSPTHPICDHGEGLAGDHRPGAGTRIRGESVVARYGEIWNCPVAWYAAKTTSISASTAANALRYFSTFALILETLLSCPKQEARLTHLTRSLSPLSK